MASLRIGMARATHGQFGMFGPTDRGPWPLWVLAIAIRFHPVANNPLEAKKFRSICGRLWPRWVTPRPTTAE